MAIKTDGFSIETDNGRITDKMIEGWEKSYSSGKMPEGYKPDKPHVGRPPLIDGDADAFSSGSERFPNGSERFTGRTHVSHAR